MMHVPTLIRGGVLPALCAATIACSDAPDPAPDPEAAAQIGEAQPIERTLPPPGNEEPRFVGLWATTQTGCSAPPWRFSADGVRTQGEVSCDFTNLRATPNGYLVSAVCHAEGNVTAHDIQFAFAEPARAMMVSDGPWAGPISLVHCGPLPPP